MLFTIIDKVTNYVVWSFQEVRMSFSLVLYETL